MINIEADVEHMPWRPSLARFTPVQGRGEGLGSTGRPPVVEVLPLYSNIEVTVAAPPPSCVGKVDEVVAPKSPGGGVHGSPAWSELEDEGAALAFAAWRPRPRARGLRLKWMSVLLKWVVLQHHKRCRGEARSRP
jgi:hypothetical protein